jgi:predicted small metal-binding protein
MKINVIGAVCALVLGLSVSSLLAADQDTMKSDTGMAPKTDNSMKSDMGMAPKMENSMSTMQDSKLYVFKCGSPCEFEVKSHDKQEVIALALSHVKTHHNMTQATEKDVEAMVQVVEPSK